MSLEREDAAEGGTSEKNNYDDEDFELDHTTVGELPVQSVHQFGSIPVEGDDAPVSPDPVYDSQDDKYADESVSWMAFWLRCSTKLTIVEHRLICHAKRSKVRHSQLPMSSRVKRLAMTTKILR